MFGIVFVHYRLPERRLAEHFRWNDDLYHYENLRVFVVTDRPLEVPPYATCLVYPEPLPIFSLAKTKNFGIAAALAAGCDPIAAIDADVAWSSPAFWECESVSEGIVHQPVAIMATTYEKRYQGHEDPHMGCAICARASAWQKTRYDERFVAYGGDDCRLTHDLSLGRRLTRDTHVWHIAHNPEVDQHNHGGHGRADCWNRDTGFNPDNANQNNKLNVW